MEEYSPILSLCIPTNGIVEWVVPLIESIYFQNVDNALFEVVITDNGDSEKLSQILSKYEYPNLYYYHTTSKGFTNQINAFEKCNGLFCKMLNHRSRLLPGSIDKMISIIRKYKDDMPILYFAEGHANGGNFISCDSVDDFVCKLSFWVSWSAGTGAWKKDLKDISGKSINVMFPHMVFLFGLRKESKYVIWNESYEEMANDTGKGGYDLFKTFGVTLLDVLNELRISERISANTFISVKKELFKFLIKLYLNEVLLPTKHTFILQNIQESVSVYFGNFYYWEMRVVSWLLMPLAGAKRWMMKLSGS